MFEDPAAVELPRNEPTITHTRHPSDRKTTEQYMYDNVLPCTPVLWHLKILFALGVQACNLPRQVWCRHSTFKSLIYFRKRYVISGTTYNPIGRLRGKAATSPESGMLLENVRNTHTRCQTKQMNSHDSTINKALSQSRSRHFRHGNESLVLKTRTRFCAHTIPQNERERSS